MDFSMHVVQGSLKWENLSTETPHYRAESLMGYP